MKRRAIAIVAALALAGVACGGDDDATDDGAATTDEANGDADSGDDEDSGDDGGGRRVVRCSRDMDSNTLFDDLDISDPDSIENTYEEAIDLMEDAADSAPDEIEADVETVIEGTKDLLEALRDADFDFATLDESVIDPETEAAATRITEYGERECGIGGDDNTGDTVDIGEIGDIGEISGTDEEIVREQMVQAYKMFGMTDEQANCVVDNIDELGDLDAANVDPTAYFDLFDDCGFDMANPGG